MIAETILQRFRQWAVDTLGVADDRVDLAPRGAEPSVFPNAPCLIVDWLSLGERQGTAGRAYTATKTATFVQYIGSIEVSAYGQQAQDWLYTLHALCDSAVFDGFDVVGLGTIIDASAQVASGIEQRYVLEFTVSYAVRVEGPPAVPTLAVTVTPNTTPNTTPGAP